MKEYKRQNAQLRLKRQANFQKNEKTMPDIKNRQNVNSMTAKVQASQSTYVKFKDQ